MSNNYIHVIYFVILKFTTLDMHLVLLCKLFRWLLETIICRFLWSYFEQRLLQVQERRQGTELCLSLAISVEDFKSEVSKTLPPETPIPNTETLRLQFMPSNSFRKLLWNTQDVLMLSFEYRLGWLESTTQMANMLQQCLEAWKNFVWSLRTRLCLSIWQGYSASWWTWDFNIYTSIWFVTNHTNATPS